MLKWTHLEHRRARQKHHLSTKIMATYLPFSDVIAAYGYRPQPPARPSGYVFLLALAYVILGGALGTVAGIGVGMASFHSGMPTLVFQVAPPVQASITAVAPPAAVPAPQPAAVVAESPVAESPAVEHVSVAAAPAPRLAKASFVVNRQHVAVSHPSAVHVQAAPQVAPAVVSEMVHVAAADPVVAIVDSTTKKSGFFSEGDATIADFDASAGRIETYDGRTFVIGTTAAATASASLQDSGRSVHYRCDQSGNCTLVNAGQVLQNVRLM